MEIRGHSWAVLLHCPVRRGTDQLHRCPLDTRARMLTCTRNSDDVMILSKRHGSQDRDAIINRAVSSVKQAAASRSRASSSSVSAASSSEGKSSKSGGMSSTVARNGCRCGSVKHKRTTHKDCPLNKNTPTTATTAAAAVDATAGTGERESSLQDVVALPTTKKVAAKATKAAKARGDSGAADAAVNAAAAAAALPNKKAKATKKRKDSNSGGSGQSRLQDRLKKNSSGRGRKRKLTASEFFRIKRYGG